jgi:hypothetical protein
MTFSKWREYKILYDRNSIPYIKMNKTRVNMNDIIITDSEKQIGYIPHKPNTLYFIKINYGVDDYVSIKPVF